MIRGIYTVRDEASGLFMGLQLNDNNDVAIRSFDYAMSHNDMMGFRPTDYSLWFLGDYDDTTGIIESKNPTMIKRGVKNGKKS